MQNSHKTTPAEGFDTNVSAIEPGIMCDQWCKQGKYRYSGKATTNGIFNGGFHYFSSFPTRRFYLVALQLPKTLLASSLCAVVLSRAQKSLSVFIFAKGKKKENALYRGCMHSHELMRLRGPRYLHCRTLAERIRPALPRYQLSPSSSSPSILSPSVFARRSDFLIPRQSCG